jgi:hypothetical protein
VYDITINNKVKEKEMALKDSDEHVFTLSVDVTVNEKVNRAYVTIYGGNRLQHNGTLQEIGHQALAESPLTKEYDWNRGDVWRPINAYETGDSVTLSFTVVKVL